MVAKIKIFYQENKMWVYLAQYMLISLALAIFAILLDVRYIPVLKYIPDLFLTSVDLAKLILSTLAGSLLTITTFTFSTIMVVLTMYSSNFSPRVVSNFLTEKITMKVLGIFIGGFFYCLLTLFFMKKTYAEVLVISATIGVIYAVLCIIYFVVFVYTVSSSVQASKLISRLYDESIVIINKTLEKRSGLETLEDYSTEYFGFSYDILSNYSGYLVLIEFEEIVRSLSDYEADLVIEKK